jgi:hypothetical protein
MRNSLAIAAAALLLSGSAQAALQPPSSTDHSASGTADPLIRLKGGRPFAIPSYHLLFQGSFNNAGGKLYDLTGDGTIMSLLGSGSSQGVLKYRVTLNALPHDSRSPRVELGVLEGQGPINGPSTPDHFTFNIQGTVNSNGYRLDLNGFIAHGFIHGDFRISGNGADGQGEFTGGQ